MDIEPITLTGYIQICIIVKKYSNSLGIFYSMGNPFTGNWLPAG